MGITIAVITGIGIALFGSIPVVWLLELGLRHDGRATITRGMIGVIVSFITSSALLLVAFFVLADAFCACGIAFVATLVIVWCAESTRTFVSMS
ncbi:hypothetical protein [Olsenella uli]|uniref:hypothetical protein n=1 Tax=Olsenella uli TaxID=133926 RepID=UPI0012AC0BA0|nr:hypothetical protein [Olsenella uli]